MSFAVDRRDPRAPGAAALFRQGHAPVEALFSPEYGFHSDIEARTAPRIAYSMAKRLD